MYVACKQLFVTLLLATVWHATYAEYNVTLYCTLIKSGTKLPSTESCSQYYSCMTPQGKYETKDCGSDYSFDKNKQTCQASANVECYYGVENPCLGKTGVHVPDVSACGQWFYCVNNEIKGSGKCPDGQTLVDGSCKYNNCEPGGTENETQVNICEIMPTNKWFGSNEDCETYLKCPENSGVPMAGACTNDLVFDVQRETCNYLSATDCTRLTDENTGTGGGGGGAGDACLVTEQGNTLPNKKVCSGYLECDQLKFVAKSCPTGQFYDEALEVCVSRKVATPVDTCDRCEGTKGSTFANAIDPTCTGYLICKDGKTTGSSKCANGYFDEDSVACVINAKPDQVASYVNSHGACATVQTCECGDKDTVTGKCVPGTNCQCGFEEVADGPCIECTPNTTTGICPTPPPECACADKNGACEDANGDNTCCGFDATSKCTSCPLKDCAYYCEIVSGVCKNSGTETDPAAIPQCGLEVAAGDCIVCPNGVEASDNICKS